ncbi:hypothetical protein BY996DRAFT_6486492 [Phakopsora pachyrhizi]|nr:hypothetical protein BY996DRAFT_6486492 [Phakopsora pachyrhizi]
MLEEEWEAVWAHPNDSDQRGSGWIKGSWGNRPAGNTHAHAVGSKVAGRIYKTRFVLRDTERLQGICKDHGGKGAEPQQEQLEERSRKFEWIWKWNQIACTVEMKLMTNELRPTPRDIDQGGVYNGSQIAVLGDEPKAHLSNSLVEDDQFIEGLVQLWSMTDSQRIGYHYLSNLNFGSTVDVGKSLGLNNYDKDYEKSKGDKRTEEQRIQDKEDIGLQGKEAEYEDKRTIRGEALVSKSNNINNNKKKINKEKNSKHNKEKKKKENNNNIKKKQLQPTIQGAGLCNKQMSLGNDAEPFRPISKNLTQGPCNKVPKDILKAKARQNYYRLA